MAASSSSWSGSKVPAEVFPMEVWQMIFNHLPDDDDVQRCYQTCVPFREMLKPKIALQALQKVFGTLKESDLLTSRLVSRPWRRNVDNYLQSRPSRLELPCYTETSVDFEQSFTNHVEKGPNRHGAVELTREKLEEARSLLQRISSNAKLNRGRNVLFGRHLIVSDKATNPATEDPAFVADNQQQLYEIVSQFLTACGPQIWHLTVTTHNGENMPRWLYHNLWDWLELLPNLKMFTLQIRVGGVVRGTHMQHMIHRVLEMGLILHPFPRVPNLVTFQLDGAPEGLLHSAIAANPQLTKVEFIPMVDSSLLRIKDVGLNNFNITEFCVTVRHYYELDRLASTGWPLEKLTVRFALFPAISYEPASLNYFAQTLKYLKIETPKISLGRDEYPWQFQFHLPLLEVLHLHTSCGVNLDFILGLSSLKELKLSMKILFYDEDCQPFVKLGKGVHAINCLYQCDIWERVATLKKVQVQVFSSVNWNKPEINFTYFREERHSGKEFPPFLSPITRWKWDRNLV